MKAKFIRLINNNSSLTCHQGCCFFNHPKFIFQASLTMQFYENQICNMLSTFWSVGLLQYMYEMLGRIKSNFVNGRGGNCAQSLLGENQNMKVCHTDSCSPHGCAITHIYDRARWIEIDPFPLCSQSIGQLNSSIISIFIKVFSN